MIAPKQRLQKVPLTMLGEGAVLASPVRDAYGRLLLAPGMPVTKTLVASLYQRGVRSAVVTEDDWRRLAAPGVAQTARTWKREDVMQRLVLVAALIGLLGFAAPGEASARSGRPILRGAAGWVGREFSTRLYYSNAFRSYIPGTGYGGFARPAFGSRGY